MRHYYNKLFAIMEERGLNNGHLMVGAKIPLIVIDQIYSGYNITDKYILQIQEYLGIGYREFMDGKKDEEPLVPIIIKPRRRSEIYQLHKRTGRVIDRFDSAREAGRKLNKEFSAITKVANGERASAYGFRWVWVEDYKEEVE